MNQFYAGLGTIDKQVAATQPAKSEFSNNRENNREFF